MDKIDAHLQARAEYENRHAAELARRRKREEAIHKACQMIKDRRAADNLLNQLRRKTKEALIRD